MERASRERAMADRTEHAHSTVFRNNQAVAVWVFMVVWLSILGCFTYVFARDGGFPDVGMFGPPLLGLFWLYGIGFAAWAFMRPCIAVSVAPGGVVAREIWPWRVRESRHAAADLSVPDVVAGTDSDGDPYFKCLLRLADDRVLVVAEGHARENVEAARRRLQAALDAV
jgi:hypothetical protein